MIGKLTGVYGGTTSDGALLVEVGGVGYVVRAPQALVLGLRSGTSDLVSLFIHTAVREDALDLYGFAQEHELTFFKQLIGISGVGPRTALGILNASDVETLKRSIAQGDATILNKVFGIGKKSAERIIVELRDKLALENGTESGMLSGDGEVIEALMSLGYRAEEARAALKDIALDPAATNTAERVSAALKKLGNRSAV